MHAIQTYAEMKAWFHPFFSSALNGGEWPGTWTGRFIPGARTPGTQWTRGYLDPLQPVRRLWKVISYTFRDSNISSSVVQSVHVVPYSTRKMKPTKCMQKNHVSVQTNYSYIYAARGAEMLNNTNSLRRQPPCTLNRLPHQILSPNRILGPVFFYNFRTGQREC